MNQKKYNINMGKKQDFNFCEKKENLCCSLCEVENFLCNINKALRCFNFYCLFK